MSKKNNNASVRISRGERKRKRNKIAAGTIAFLLVVIMILSAAAPLFVSF